MSYPNGTHLRMEEMQHTRKEDVIHSKGNTHTKSTHACTQTLLGHEKKSSMCYVEQPGSHMSQTVWKCRRILFVNVSVEHAFPRLLGSAFQQNDPE